MRKRIYRKILILVAATATVFCAVLGYQNAEAWGISDEITNVADMQEDMVFLGGMPVGLYLQTDGVMVINTEEIEDDSGSVCSPARHIVKTGDYITAVNQENVKNKRELIRQIQECSSESILLSLRRNDQTLEVKIKPVVNAEGTKMLGIWVRDDVQGLGTVTYIRNNEFAALGHGIHDTDTSELLEVERGVLYKTNIRSITKSSRGKPGSMEGIIVYHPLNILGSIDSNKETGIYGTLKDTGTLLEHPTPIQIASRDEVKTGEATIRCKVTDEIQEYKIQIIDLDYSEHEINKGMTIEVTDPELLEITGGIVQGMSGSPIIQNGKLIGAVTHVFIKDSKKGYGIFIDHMME